MLYPRLAFVGAAMLAVCGSLHAADPAASRAEANPAVTVTTGVERVAAVQLPAVAVAQPGPLRADAVQVAVNTLDTSSPAARAAQADGDVPVQYPFSSYLLSATRYVQDMGTFLSPAEAAPKKMSQAPLPGALWLFGSGLLAFLAISVRRKF